MKPVYSTTLQSACIEWAGTRTTTGYGLHRGKPAHRAVWEKERGPIPPGMFIDHMCRNRACVNVEHLRVVTPAVNCMENSDSVCAVNGRKTHCKHGHEFTPENTYWYRQGKAMRRVCRICKCKLTARYYREVGKANRQRSRKK